MTLDMLEIDHDDTLDDRICQFAQDTRDLLGLGAWDIVIKMVDSLDLHDETDQVERYGQDVAQCTYREPYRIAEIRLVRGRTEAEYRESVMHEMLHLVISPLDHVAHQIADFLRPRHARASQAMIEDAVERVVSSLAKALVAGIRPPAGTDGEGTRTEPDGVDAHA